MGNTQWSYWLDSLQPDRRGPGGAGGSYEVFRFVNKIDLVPRLPLAVFSHAGHTLQITYGGEIEVRLRRPTPAMPRTCRSRVADRTISGAAGVLRSRGERGPRLLGRAARMGR